MAYQTEVLADSPLLYWRLSEASGTTAQDATANNRDGTYTGTGVTYEATGPITSDGADTAVTLNGTSGAVSSNATLDLSAFSAVTVEFWMNAVAFNTSDDLAFETSANYNSNNGALHVDPNDALTSAFALAFKGGAGIAKATFVWPSTGVWHHYAFIYRTGTGAGAITAYVDGQPVTMTDRSTPNIPAFGNFTVYLGSRGAASLFIAGGMDELAIYGSALSAERIEAHFDAATEAAAPASAAITGTAGDGCLESDIVAGGQTIIITLTDDTWVATVGDDNAITTALIAGIDSAQAEAAGWDAVVKANMTHAEVVRTSDTVVTITLAEEATYAITAHETITVTIPATALTGGEEVVATPTFQVTNQNPPGSGDSLLLLGVG